MNTEPMVYVVDDDLGVLKSMRWLIESEGLSVETFPSGTSFLENYDDTCPGCLLLDMRMPGMNGLEVQSRLVEQRIELPIIMMTGHGDVPVCVKSFKFGAFDFFEKPANDTALLGRIKQAITADVERRRFEMNSPMVNARLSQLTPREKEVMELVVHGKTLKQIALQLSISMQTAAKHRAKVHQKLVVENDAELVRLALESTLAPRK